MSQTQPKRRILHVEPDADVRDLVASCLEAAGYRVVPAESAQVAIETVARYKFDLALVEQRLPLMPGEELLRTMRDVDPAMSIVLTTGDFGTAVAETLGADAVFTKPYEMGNLTALVRSLLDSDNLETAHER